MPKLQGKKDGLPLAGVLGDRIGGDNPEMWLLRIEKCDGSLRTAMLSSLY